MEKIIQITSGRGPAECNLAVKKVLNYMLKEMETFNVAVEQQQVEMDAELPCSVTLKLKGKEVDGFADRWIGTILWTCKSPFRPFHKRKNWFVAVLEITPPAAIVEIDERDVLYQSMRSSGPGGQHVNKVSTGVRAMHIPTGLKVQVMDSRSQHRNKQLALIRLREKMMKQHADGSMQAQNGMWLNQISIARGNPKRTFTEMTFRER